jgi:hypothetical protein
MTSIEPDEGRPRGSAEFVESAVLEAIAPASSVDIEELLQSWDGSADEESSSILPFVSQRPILLFGKLRCSATCLHKLSYSFPDL